MTGISGELENCTMCKHRIVYFEGMGFCSIDGRKAHRKMCCEHYEREWAIWPH